MNDTSRNIPKVIGMIHALALPGTPAYKTSNGKRGNSGIQMIINQAQREAEVFANFPGVYFIQLYEYTAQYLPLYNI